MSTLPAILISGLGAVSAAGAGINETLKTFSEGKRLISSFPSAFETSLDCPVMEVKDFSAEPSKTIAMAKVACEEALVEAKSPREKGNLKIGVVVGTTVGCMFQSLDFYKDYKKGTAPDSGVIKKYLRSDPAKWLKNHFHFEGPFLTVTTACASGANAIGIGSEWIKAGLCDMVLAGGTDELDLIPYTGFNSLMLLSKSPCKPFDKNRNGLNLGEGAGFVVLESFKSAQARGFKSDLFLAGYGTATDAWHLTGPHPEGLYLERAIHKAFQAAGISALEIGYVNAHGTSTPENDKTEGKVLKKLFSHSGISSTKGFTGHTLGAAGGLEAVFSALALRHEFIPPNAGFEEEDPEIGFSPVTESRSFSGTYVLSTSLGFGGVNAALIVGKNP